MKLEKLIVDVPWQQRLATYQKIDEYILSFHVGAKRTNGFVKNRLELLFKRFSVKVVPVRNDVCPVHLESKLSVPVLDRKTQSKYLVFVGSVKTDSTKNQMSLI